MSLLDAKGVPTVVERAWMLPPASRIGPISDDERRAVIGASMIAGRYETAVDRDSAYERLTARTAERSDTEAAAPSRGAPSPTSPRPPAPGTPGSLNDLIFGRTGPRGGKHEGILESAARSAARSVGSGLGRQILRGMLGSIFGGRR